MAMAVEDHCHVPSVQSQATKPAQHSVGRQGTAFLSWTFLPGITAGKRKCWTKPTKLPLYTHRKQNTRITPAGATDPERKRGFRQKQRQTNR